MLVNFDGKHNWWFMEVPRTGTSTIDRTLRKVFPAAEAIYAKHWPLPPPAELRNDALSLISIRNPFSRAVSCWQYFTKPDSISFVDWTAERGQKGWTDIYIEARPQTFWFNLWKWDVVLRQEYLNSDFWDFVARVDLNRTLERFDLQRFNDINGTWVNRVKARTCRTRHWRDYYCPAAERNVLEIYDADFTGLASWYSRNINDAT
jgi:hypothetical protein